MAEQPDHKALRLFVEGTSGMGKSTYLVKFLQGAAATCRFVFDPEGSFKKRLARPAVTRKEDLVPAARSGWVIYDPAVMFPGEFQKGFDFFARWSWWMSNQIPGRKVFAVDELQTWSGTGSKGIGPGLSLVLEGGRRYGLDSILVTLASNAVHNRIRGSATDIVAFRTTEDIPLAWLEGKGFDREEIKMLPAFRYVLRVAGRAETWRGQVTR